MRIEPRGQINSKGYAFDVDGDIYQVHYISGRLSVTLPDSRVLKTNERVVSEEAITAAPAHVLRATCFAFLKDYLLEVAYAPRN